MEKNDNIIEDPISNVIPLPKTNTQRAQSQRWEIKCHPASEAQHTKSTKPKKGSHTIESALTGTAQLKYSEGRPAKQRPLTAQWTKREYLKEAFDSAVDKERILKRGL